MLHELIGALHAMKMEARNWNVEDLGAMGVQAVRAGKNEFVKFPYKKYEAAQLLTQLHCLAEGLRAIGLSVDLPIHWLAPLEE